MDQQRQPYRRLLRQRNAEHHQRRRRQQYFGYIGYYSGSTGTATIDGTGSTWTNSGSLYVGYSGTGIVTQTGGTVSVAGVLALGSASAGKGTYNLNGGVLAVDALSRGAGTAAFNFGGGTLLANAAFSTTLPMNLTGTGGTASVDTQSYAVTLSGTLSGVGGITKLGAGTLTLSGANSYAGTTTVKAGMLELGTAAETPCSAARRRRAGRKTRARLHRRLGYRLDCPKPAELRQNRQFHREPMRWAGATTRPTAR